MLTLAVTALLATSLIAPVIIPAIVIVSVVVIGATAAGVIGVVNGLLNIADRVIDNIGASGQAGQRQSAKEQCDCVTFHRGQSHQSPAATLIIGMPPG